MDRICSECEGRYGPRTCILWPANGRQYNMYFLDNGQTSKDALQRSDLYMVVPKLIANNYTVVIVEEAGQYGKEITAVHLPVQNQLITPPIIQ